MADEIPNELRELVVNGEEGNPFYLEELIKMLIEDGVIVPDEETWRIEPRRLEQVNVPSTLADVLQARLDSLPIHECTVLQQASVVGRLFWDCIVAYIQTEGGNGDDPQIITQALTSLRNRELVNRHEESAFVDAVEYLFKHDVVREVPYESVLKRLRKTYNGLVADWLIANNGDRIGEYRGLIAEHFLQASRNEQACKYFSQAGDSALASYANAEAEGYYRQALIFLHQISCAQIFYLDWAEAMRELSDEIHPEAEKIIVVLDNLNIHTPAAFYLAFEPDEAIRLVNRFEFHFTPKHGSLLNMAEIELSVLSRQCINRRIPDEETLKNEVPSFFLFSCTASTALR